MNRIKAKYLIETPFPLDQAAEVLAGEQSSGTFVPVPGETASLKERFAAQVTSIEALDTVTTPSLPGAASNGESYRRALIEVSWSVENVGFNLSTLVSTLQGNLYELPQFTGLKLMDIDFPEDFGSHYKGPAFGIKGCRELTGVGKGRPLIGTIIKPSIGLAPEQTAETVARLAAAGIDFVKDDELMASPANSPFEKRVEAVMKVIHAHADKTGKMIMYAFNISDEWEAMQRNYDKILEFGGNTAMISINSVGLAATKALCDRRQLVIHAHRNGWGMLNRHPLLGMDFRAYQKLWRLAGVDQIHVNGIRNKFWESDDSVVASIGACFEPVLGGFEALPVISSGQWGGQAFETFRRTRSTDFLYLAGGGILAHPMGPEGGVVALKQSWEAAVNGLSIEEAASSYAEFGQSVKKFAKIHHGS